MGISFRVQTYGAAGRGNRLAEYLYRPLAGASSRSCASADRSSSEAYSSASSNSARGVRGFGAVLWLGLSANASCPLAARVQAT